MTLTEKDVKKIKQERKIAYVLAVILLLLASIFNLYWLLTKQTYSVLLLIDSLIILICVLMVFFMNKNYNKDLRERKKKIISKEVQLKSDYDLPEVGSGALYIPILGKFFPKLWGHKMRVLHVYYLQIDNYRHEVEKDLFDKITTGDRVNMYYAKHSNLLLEIELAGRE